LYFATHAIKGHGLRQLNTLPQLTTLDLRLTKLNDEGLAAVSDSNSYHLRENARKRNRFIVLSSDAGKTFTAPRELPGSLTGDRHPLKYTLGGKKKQAVSWTTIFMVVVIMTGPIMTGPGRAELGYNRDVLPILAETCLACHGADQAKRQAKLRLDQRESALSQRDGVRAIVPGKPDESALARKIFSSDPDEVMPPPEEARQLTNEEKAVLKKWIGEGATYEKHWAFIPPKQSTVPNAELPGHNEIDRFIHARLAEAGLSLQIPASKEELIRRVTFDLTGLPPGLQELDAFLADEKEQAYQQLIDRLLASSRYGERMAMWWLDGARYGDSHGFDNDLHNNQWPWRNWVIESFNANKPFHEFTIEQLAGDLLPDATEQQVLATAFNRNHRIQTEDGAIDEEWRTEYVIDRVETMGAVWMGLTLNCARCHDHKYDPISQKDFYQLFSLFNNLDEKGFINNLRGSAEPRVRYRESTYQRKHAEFSKIEDKGKREQAIREIDAGHPTVMVMKEMEKPRIARMLGRGQYHAPGEEVRPGLPGIFDGPGAGVAVNRLVLARWLVDGKHPLTARVTVNRLWEQLFGRGLVESSENLGVQADWPTHPELLDWLAVDFTRDWDIKRLLKRIVMSATYKQSAVVDAERLQLDPNNALLSRGPRFRLPAEMVRDQALAISGLLHEQLGGPSVWPYQPDRLWEDLEKRGTFKQDHGNKLYRRQQFPIAPDAF